MDAFRKRLQKAFSAAMPYASWAIGIALCLAAVIVAVAYLPDTIKQADLSSHIALVTQVLSVLVGFAFVGATLYLSSYGISDKVSGLLKGITEYANKLKSDYLDRDSEHRKLSNTGFIETSFSRTGISRLKFNDPNVEGYSNFYVYRPYWDGVWYQVYDSPFSKEQKSDEQLAAIQALHETVVCAAKIFGIIFELRTHKLNLISLKSGSQGSKVFIKRFEAFVSDFQSLKKGITPDQMKSSDASMLVRMALNSEHYMYEELNEYAEEVSWDPYEVTYFEVIVNEYFIWLTYLLLHVGHLRFAILESRAPGLLTRISDATKEKYNVSSLMETKKTAFELRKEAISAFGVNKRYKEIRVGAIPGVGSGVITLLVIVLFWPLSSALTEPLHIKFLFGLLFGLGILGIIKSGEFVVLMLIGTMNRINRSPMGSHG
ncbi:hypothetical protein MGA5115_03514 [Marinomonas gallaica]|uniref:Uncharacterized protein n=1 Tax=Marinomonas gallaica TaxID=1806667 RepID=A0A1C3JW48_9GAMM|nr:hypothetical protein [Marinomonas gallaica]SBT19352.1 hypothetical protein MGA5115_03514 [Marinomonas gallaica]SBT22824.1 hypothetical protein MGA5116_03454 [Marinomonas gallaica]